jgi:heterodisulfide reductase subunit A2
MSTYIVVGAGVAGCAAALEMARAGYKVEMLEADGRIGGKALSYCCKATDSCSRCGVCTAHDLFAEVLAHPKISVRTSTALLEAAVTEGKTAIRIASKGPAIDAKACIDCGRCVPACPSNSVRRYSRGGVSFHYIEPETCAKASGESCSRCADACPTGAIRFPGSAKTTLHADGIILAIGHNPFDPVKKPRLGFGRFPNVFTGAEAEEILSRRMTLTRDGESAPESVAFIQCVGSRDPALKRNWCSAVCCAYALRMARLLKHRNPKAEITVYTIDIQNFDKAFSAFRAELSDLGVQIVRGVPSSVGAGTGGRLRLLIEDPKSGARTAEHDAVVLSVGLGPDPGARRAAGLLGLIPNPDGFLPDGIPGVRTAGTCAEPQSIPDSMAQGRAAALDLMRSRG